MKILYLVIFLISFSFPQLRISIDSNGTLDNLDISSGVSISYDKTLLKQENIKMGLGLEHMFARDSENGNIKNLESNLLYIFMRYAYEKKWSSYLKMGFNSFKGNAGYSGMEGLAWGFGADYKLNDLWHIELGYHILSTEEENYSRIVSSIARHFKKKDDE